jgi:spoIIIJ-associated protein
MSQEYIEITEKTLDEAITTACRRLSVTSTRLDYVVVQKEKSGFLGIGAKPAIIKARVKDASEVTQAILDDVISKAEKKLSGKAEAKKPAEDMKKAEEKAEKASVKEVEKAEKKAEKAEKKEKEKEAKKTVKKNKKKAPASVKDVSESIPAASKESDAEEKAAPAPKKKPAIPQLTDEEISKIKKTAHDFLVDIFKAMEMEVDISEDYQKDTGILTVNMEGEDMGVLIGKRGQTLDSLQYLLSLVINKDVDGYIHVKADTENYRERRKKTLENLAKNIAFKVKRTRQLVALEPMNPYERRIIHSALQNEKFITTYSEGEEPYRKVIVALKKDENGEELLKEERFEKGGRGRNGRGGRNSRGGRKGRDRRGSKDNRRSSDNAGDVAQEGNTESFTEE